MPDKAQTTKSAILADALLPFSFRRHFIKSTKENAAKLLLVRLTFSKQSVVSLPVYLTIKQGT